MLIDSCSQYDLIRDIKSIHRSSAATAGYLSLFELVYFSRTLRYRNCDTSLILVPGLRSRERSSEPVSRLGLEVGVKHRRRHGSCDVNHDIKVRGTNNIWNSRVEFVIEDGRESRIWFEAQEILGLILNM